MTCHSYSLKQGESKQSKTISRWRDVISPPQFKSRPTDSFAEDPVLFFNFPLRLAIVALIISLDRLV